MCGRYALNASSSQVIEQFQLEFEDTIRDSNLKIEKEIYPSKVEEVVIRKNNKNALEAKTWGVKNLPSKGEPIDQINVATIERLETSPLWKKAIHQKRILIPVTSYFEWKEVDPFTTEKYEIFPSHNEVFAFAGLDIVYVDSFGKKNDCFVIITTEANQKISEIHHRQPALIEKNEYLRWLNDGTKNPIALIQKFSNERFNYKKLWTKTKKNKKQIDDQLYLF
ncbi:MAG: SOS response-associated peptidase family protein [Leptospira sp.]|nr:SOS response-associated peptidase family protein [Leptospira sp.]